MTNKKKKKEKIHKGTGETIENMKEQKNMQEGYTKWIARYAEQCTYLAINISIREPFLNELVDFENISLCDRIKWLAIFTMQCNHNKGISLKYDKERISFFF